MTRRWIRALWPLAILLAVFAWRAVGCKKKPEAFTQEEKRTARWQTIMVRYTPSKVPPGTTRRPTSPPE